VLRARAVAVFRDAYGSSLISSLERSLPMPLKRVHEVQKAIHRARQLARHGMELCPAVWVIEGALAIVQRPLRDHPEFGGRGAMRSAAKPELERWAENLRQRGVRAILCLSHQQELAHYDPLQLHSDGLLGFLCGAGFAIAHVPALDPAHGKTPEERQARRGALEELKQRAKVEFDRLPKPVAIFCSAGIDRSTPIAIYIAAQRPG
jgi:hypothetical protein